MNEMKIFNDPAFRRELLMIAAITAIISLLLLIASPLLALGALISGIILGVLYAIMMRRRNQRIAELSGKLGGILRGEDALRLEQYSEGELSVLQSELQKLLLQLESAKLSAIEERKMLADSLADISHQLRTPLTSIELIITMLRSPSLPPERRQPLLQDLTRRTEQVQWLVESLLKLSQLDAGAVKLRMEEIPIRELLDTASEPLAVSMELRGISFVVHAGDEALSCDKQWTAEAVGNLLKNAIEHSPEGGTIDLSVTDTPIYLQLSLRDDGPGFPEDEIPHLFERFYRGSTASSGSYGIGLSLTRRILSEENATIRAANAPGGGAEFTLRFYKTAV